MKNEVWSWIIVKNKRILLIKRIFNKNMYPNYWAPPWWSKENNETPEQITIREVKEEVWLDFIPTELYIKNESERCIFYKHIWTFSWDIKIEIEECDGYWWFTYDESIKLLIHEDIKFLLNKLRKDNIL